jgi:chromosome segregation ATPase
MNQKQTTNLLTLIIIVLIIGIGFAAYKLVILNRNFDVLNKEIEKTISAKDLLEEDLKFLYSEYDSIQTENDSMNVKLKEEQEKIAVLLNELKSVKAYNASQIRQYQGEIETLRGIMKSYVFQIDSLNQLNNELIAENNAVRESHERLKYEMDEVVEKNDVLEMTVEKASTIKATNITSRCFNNRGRENDKAKKVTQVQTSFTLIENQIAEQGERTIYLRIIRPDGFVLIQNSENVFEFEEEIIAFTESRKVLYDGNFLDVIIYYNANQEFLEGKYDVELYMNGTIIGTSSFLLK